MKQRVLIWLFFVGVVFVACEPYSREYERMNAALEQAKVVYGTVNLDVDVDINTALFIPNLAESSAFFARKKQYDKAALAALYQGYSEKDFDKTVAMESFKEAEHYGEMAGDSLTIARAEYWMGYLLYEDYMHNEAIEQFCNAMALFEESYAEKALTMNAAACCFIVLREYDSASKYFEQCLYYSDLAHSDNIRNKTLNNYAVLLKITGNYDKAIECLKLIKTNNDELRLQNYIILTSTFDEAGLTDSAIIYFKRMVQTLEVSKLKVETICATYKTISSFAERQGDLEFAMENRKKYEKNLEILLDQRAHKSIYRIQQKYDHEALKYSLSKKITNRQRIIAIACLLLALMTIAFGLSQQRLTVKTKQESEARERILYYVQRYYEALAKQGKTMTKVAMVMDNKDDKALMSDLVKTVFGNRDLWDAIYEVFDNLYPEKRKTIEENRPTLTELEKKSIILSYLGVSRQDEALLLKINIHSVDKLRQSVRKKTKEMANNR